MVLILECLETITLGHTEVIHLLEGCLIGMEMILMIYSLEPLGCQACLEVKDSQGLKDQEDLGQEADSDQETLAPEVDSDQGAGALVQEDLCE